MHLRHATLIMALLSMLLPAAGLAADKKDKFMIRTTDNLKDILEQEIDLPVKLILKSGTELRGTVVRVGSGVVQIAEVAGMEVYDAVVSIADISAILIKVRKL